MTLLFLKLLLAHTIGDFLLQPGRWVKDKGLKKHKSKYLYFHILIHLALLIVTLEFKLEYWLGILTIVFSHYLIDVAKLNLNKFGNPVLLFIADQIAHVIVLFAVAAYYENFALSFSHLYTEKNISLIIALIAITWVSAIVMQIIMSQWDLKEDDAQNSLPKAGLYIGILERLFVFGFIATNQWQAIGLLIAAKSVFRFSDLSKARDRKLTEYILIGTLLSFVLAISISLVYQYFKTI